MPTSWRARLCRREFPLLGQAARETGGIATQNRGTIGGNIANASPAADTPPALLVYDAESGRRLRARHAPRRLQQLPHGLQEDGPRAGRADRQRAPAATGARGRASTIERSARAARRRSRRCASPVRSTSTTAIVRDVRLAFGSVAPACIRASSAEAALRGRLLDREAIAAARAALARDIAPIDDMRSTARYRATVAGNVMEAFLVGS